MVAECKIALRPELGLAGTSCIEPGGACFIGGACESSGRATTMYIAISVASHTREAQIARATKQEGRSLRTGGSGLEAFLLPDHTQGSKLFREMFATGTILYPGCIVVLFARPHREAQ